MEHPREIPNPANPTITSATRRISVAAARALTGAGADHVLRLLDDLTQQPAHLTLARMRTIGIDHDGDWSRPELLDAIEAAADVAAGAAMNAVGFDAACLILNRLNDLRLDMFDSDDAPARVLTQAAEWAIYALLAGGDLDEAARELLLAPWKALTGDRSGVDALDVQWLRGER